MAVLVGVGEEMRSVLIEPACLSLPHLPALQRFYLELRDLNAVELTYLWRSSHYIIPLAASLTYTAIRFKYDQNSFTSPSQRRRKCAQHSDHAGWTGLWPRLSFELPARIAIERDFIIFT